jgi:proliferating cell nuclear antigen
MFLARFNQASILKKIVDSIKELVNNVNIDAGPTAISMQAMDPSHVALVSLTLKEQGFAEYRSDGVLTLGIAVQNLAKVLKLADSDDELTLKAEEQDPSFMTLIFEDNSNIILHRLTLRKREVLGVQSEPPPARFGAARTSARHGVLFRGHHVILGVREDLQRDVPALRDRYPSRLLTL